MAEVPGPVPGEAPAGAVSITEAEIAANRRRAAVLSAVDGLVAGIVLGVVLGLVVGAVIGAVVGVVVLVLGTALVRRSADRAAVAMLGAVPLGDGEDPGLENLVEGLCATFGLRVPALMVVDDDVPNACALGRDPSHAVVVVTSGLLDRLDLIEMEGVVAHELAHVKRHDTTVSGAALAALRPWGWLGASERWLHAAVGPGREYRADQVAAATVRYPPGLRDALVALSQGPAPAPGSVFSPRALARTRWLWIDPMVGRRQGVSLTGENDATAVRIAALGEW